MSDKKPKRNRSVHINFWASEEEATLIRERMKLTGIVGLGTFMRKMAIEGYHINVDMTDIREMVSLLRRCSINLNQIAKRANETRNIYEADIEDLREQYDKLWDTANDILSGLAKIK